MTEPTPIAVPPELRTPPIVRLVVGLLVLVAMLAAVLGRPDVAGSLLGLAEDVPELHEEPAPEVEIPPATEPEVLPTANEEAAP